MVNFEEATLIKEPYVVINGVEYPVHPPEYSGGTALSPENMNKLQTDLKKIIEDEVAKITTYSIDEKETGIWIEGKKVYRKIVNIGDMKLTTNTNYSVAHNISNFGTLINLELRMTYNSSSQYSFWNGISRLTANSTHINIFATETSSFTDAFAIIEYTKK